MVAQGINSQLSLFSLWPSGKKSEKLQWMEWERWVELILCKSFRFLFCLNSLFVLTELISLFFVFFQPVIGIRGARGCEKWQNVNLKVFYFVFTVAREKRVKSSPALRNILRKIVYLLFMFCYDSLLVKVVKTTPTIFNHLFFLLLPPPILIWKNIDKDKGKKWRKQSTLMGSNLVSYI